MIQLFNSSRNFISSEHNQYSYENIWVAIEDDRILGEICLYDGADLVKLRTPVLSYVNGDDSKRFDSIEDETASGEFYIDTIAVSSAARGKGVGQLLLHHVIEMYVQQRNLTLGLLVDKGNPKAKSLYLRTGFVYREDVLFLGKTMEHLQLSPSQ